MICCRTLEELLLELSLCDFDLDGLVDLLLVAPLVVGIVLDGRGEQRVDEGGLSEAGLASNHDSESSTTLSHDLVTLVRELCISSASPILTDSIVGDIHWQYQSATATRPWCRY